MMHFNKTGFCTFVNIAMPDGRYIANEDVKERSGTFICFTLTF